MFDPISYLPRIIEGLLDVIMGGVRGKVDNATSIELKKAEKEIEAELSKLKHQQDLERLKYTQRHELQIKLLSLLDKIDVIQLSSPEQIAAVQKLMQIALSLANENYVERIEKITTTIATTMRNITPLVEPPSIFVSPPPNSAAGVDYHPLKALLKAGRWQEADQETLKMMLEVVGREKNGYLREEDINRFFRFFYKDLRTINQLWVKYSNGCYGFSIQTQIWQEVGANYENFYDCVGWLATGVPPSANNNKEGHSGHHPNLLWAGFWDFKKVEFVFWVTQVISLVLIFILALLLSSFSSLPITLQLLTLQLFLGLAILLSIMLPTLLVAFIFHCRKRYIVFLASVLPVLP